MEIGCGYVAPVSRVSGLCIVVIAYVNVDDELVKNVVTSPTIDNYYAQNILRSVI